MMKSSAPGPVDAEATSDAEKEEDAEVTRPSKRKRGSDNGSASKNGCAARGQNISSATTKGLEKEKLCLKEINTSKKGRIDQFFPRIRYNLFSGYPSIIYTRPFALIYMNFLMCSKKSAEKPKKQKTKPSPATMPSTPEVGAPSKSASSTEPLKEMDVIHIDDEPETIGGTDKGASTKCLLLMKNKEILWLKLRLMMPSQEMRLYVVRLRNILICF
jgi:hypothetical protein